MARRNRQAEKDNKTEVVMGLAFLVDTGAKSKTTGEPIKRSVAYLNITDLVSDVRLETTEDKPESILDWLKKFEVVVVDQNTAETVAKGSID